MKLLRFTILLVSLSESAFALPNMVRLGYTNCVSCHVTPQGGGLLNPYGKGIDEAQSFERGGIWPPHQGIRQDPQLGLSNRPG